MDIQLEKLGGKRITPIQKCDVDFETEAHSWFTEVLNKLSLNGSHVENNGTLIATATPKKSSTKKIYKGTILTNIVLNDIGSEKETHHIEIAADDLDYFPGDSIGVIPENPLHIVEPIIELLGIGHSEIFIFRQEELSAYELLKRN